MSLVDECVFYCDFRDVSMTIDHLWIFRISVLPFQTDWSYRQKSASLGLYSLRQLPFKAMLVNKNVLTWLLIGWQLCQPIRSHVRKALFADTGFNMDLAWLYRIYIYCRAESRFAPGQWATALLCNDVSHWLGANLEPALYWVKREAILPLMTTTGASPWFSLEVTLWESSELMVANGLT